MTDAYPHRAVAIIGGGPAGLMLALSLQQRGCRDLAIIEPGLSKAQRLAESIPPPTAQTLGEWGVDLSQGGHLPCYGTVSEWGSPIQGYNDYLAQPGGLGYWVDRTDLETQLKQRYLEQGGNWLDASVESGQHHDRTVNALQIRSAHGLSNLTADLVVDASGSGVLLNQLGVAQNRIDGLIYHYQLYHRPDDLPQMGHIQACDRGWWYCAPVSEQQILVAFVTDKQHRLKPTATLPPMPLLKRTLQPCTELRSRQADLAIRSAVVGPNWLAVGDAACRFDPINAAGISKAIATGHAGAEAIMAWRARPRANALRAYQQAIFADFTHHVNLRQQLYHQIARIHPTPFWQRRCQPE
ncbi:NAD(P)/FAD-dependent oxidoreductase [Ferrimonas pelagia]|uniref:NAD(P)/FAD-dependent oxidoreductase n=1 Tax=Ferrimonas pelagia TaxID=1177826 RepID=A0ABP9EP00_9GAMM